MPPPSQVKMQGSQASLTVPAHVLPDLTGSRVSGPLRLGVGVVAPLGSKFGVIVSFGGWRKLQGATGRESSLCDATSKAG